MPRSHHLFTSEWIDAAIVGLILAASVGIGYRREYRAESTIAALLERIQITAEVLRDGARRTIPAREVVPGDVVLAAGSIVPADGVLLDATDLHVDDLVEADNLITLAALADGRILYIVSTVRDDRLRIISAREATSNERRPYEEAD